MVTDQHPDEGGLSFPCLYPVKAMIRSGEAARQQVLALASQHAPFDPQQDVRTRPSRNGRFESLTITVSVDSREQLERLYTELRALDAVVMTL